MYTRSVHPWNNRPSGYRFAADNSFNSTQQATLLFDVKYLRNGDVVQPAATRNSRSVSAFCIV